MLEIVLHISAMDFSLSGQFAPYSPPGESPPPTPPRTSPPAPSDDPATCNIAFAIRPRARSPPAMTATARWLAAAATALLTLALAAARPQFSLFGQPAGPQVQPPFVPSGQHGPQVQPPFVPSPDDEGTVGHGTATVSGDARAALLQPGEPPLGASTTLGHCPRNASRLLNDPVARLPLYGARVATKIRYDGHGCFGERDCFVSCVKIEAPHAGWRPTTVSITGGGLGQATIEVTITSPVSHGYSVRVLLYGLC